MLGTLLSMVGFDLKSRVRSIATTAIFALAGAILIALALAFGIAALYEWLKLQTGTLPALGILGGTWAVLGLVFFAIAFLRPKGRHRRAPAINPLREPAAVIAQATEQAVDDATSLVREGSRKQVFGAVLVAVLTGFLIGRRF
jgi:formate-dependent nitrite reductase membrane component NrfD